MADNERNNWDQANQQGKNLDTSKTNCDREFHNEDDRHQNSKAEGTERQSDEYNDDSGNEKRDVAKNDFSESDDSYGHGSEYYSKNYGAGGRSSADDIPTNDSGA